MLGTLRGWWVKRWNSFFFFFESCREVTMHKPTHSSRHVLYYNWSILIWHNLLPSFLPYAGYVACQYVWYQPHRHVGEELTCRLTLHHLFCFPGPLFVVVEFAAHGNLRQFLQERRPGLEYHNEADSLSPEQLTLQDLMSYCYQVAKGMEFLSSRKVNNNNLGCLITFSRKWNKEPIRCYIFGFLYATSHAMWLICLIA